MEDVALAEIGGTPASVSAPKVRNVPPPAMALTTPDRKPAMNRSAIKASDMFSPWGQHASHNPPGPIRQASSRRPGWPLLQKCHGGGDKPAPLV
ncbi:hypothetical protein D3C87_1729750 [compost metagenome]